jgi:hypothetical protein
MSDPGGCPAPRGRFYRPVGGFRQRCGYSRPRSAWTAFTYFSSGSRGTAARAAGPLGCRCIVAGVRPWT